jgi:RimJ/RimL family protein N-acetyltransferase
VTEFFVRALSRAESDAQLTGSRARLAADGYGKYAAEEKASGRFIGYVGLAPVDFPADFAPAIEIGWRLARESWGSGYATEGARAVLNHAFGAISLDALVSFTTEWNMRSRRVMEKIGMSRDSAGDFDHPRVPPSHKLRRHVLYRIDRTSWLTRQAAG